MSDWKEVWHVWGGLDYMPKNTKKALCQCAVLIDNSGYLNSADSYDDWYSNKPFIQIYTTGQMRRRVDCDICDGHGLSIKKKICPVDGSISKTKSPCLSCNGKGYQWEYKNNG